MANQRMGKDPFAKNKSLDWVASTSEVNEPIEKEQLHVEQSQIDETKTPGRPKALSRKIEKSSQEGLATGWTRATFIVSEDNLKKLKAVAYWDRKPIKDVVSEALSTYLDGKDVEDIPCR
jgi:hypothetical protein